VKAQFLGFNHRPGVVNTPGGEHFKQPRVFAVYPPIEKARALGVSHKKRNSGEFYSKVHPPFKGARCCTPHQGVIFGAPTSLPYEEASSL